MKGINLKKIISWTLKLGFSIAAIVLIYYKVDLGKVLTYGYNSNWLLLLLSVIAFFTSKVFASFRVNCFYRSKKILLPEITNIKLTFLGMYYGLFIPFVGGEGFKVYWLKKEYQASAKTLSWIALMDRLSGVVALVVLALFSFFCSSFQLDYKFLVLLLIPILYGFHFLFNKLFFDVGNVVWFKSSFYSLVVQFFQVVCAFFIIKSLHIEEGLIEYLFVFLLASLAFVAPFIGARELAFVFGAEKLGLDKEWSLTISLFFYLAMATNSLMGAYYLLFPKKLKD